MLRAIAFCLTLLAFAVPANAQQKTAPTWESWLAEVKATIVLKDEAIPDLTNHRDRICPLLATSEKKADCKTRFAEIVERRKKEKLILLSESDAFSKLPRIEAIAIAEIANPAYQKMDAETTDLFNVAYALYPKQQASAK